MTLTRAKMRLAALACAGVSLITTATCDPYTGTFDFFRDDDRDYFLDDGLFYLDDGYYYEEVIYYDDYGYYDDCFWFDCF